MKKEANKKAQFTVFVILGFMMLVVMGFLLLLINVASENSTQQEARRLVNDYLDSESINYYVYTCLESATNKAVDELMIQGGIYYADQEEEYGLEAETTKHIQLDITFEETGSSPITKQTNVSYGLTKINPCPVIEYSIPEFPLHRTRLSSLYNTYRRFLSCSRDLEANKDYSGFFGYNQLTRLCYHGSENQLDGSNFISPCKHNAMISTNNVSIESKLKNRIQDLLNECIDFEYIGKIQGHNITVNESERELKIILNRNTLSVEATYPFRVSLRNRNPVLVRHSFNYASNLRVTKLHNFAIMLLFADASLHNFDIKKDYNNPFFHQIIPNLKNYYDSYFDVEVIEFLDTLHNHKYDRVLIIKDRASYIGGRPLTFATAIQNRNPALDLIHQYILELNADYDIFVQEGEGFQIIPEGYDPDDRALRYEYSGWKETYDEICHVMLGSLNCQTIPITDDFIKLTDSEEFQQTRRIVSYPETTSTDIGLHVVRVTIYDKEELYDYQDVKIFVFKQPEAEIDLEKPYPPMDIPDNTISIEDPAWFNAKINNTEFYETSETYDSLDMQIIKLNWLLTDSEGNEIINETHDELNTPINEIQEFRLPRQDYTIQTIKRLNLTNIGNYALTAFFTVKVQDGQGGTIGIFSNDATFDFEAKQCIPHRATQPSYPYSTTNFQIGQKMYGEGFGANHTCCTDNYEYQGEDKKCYEATWYGEFQKLKQKAQDLMKTNMLTNYEGTSSLTFNPNHPAQNRINSIYKLVFERNCDGERGNICAGDATATLTIQGTPCSYNSNLLEQCNGPPIQNMNPSSIPMLCQAYTTTTLANPISFEKIFTQEGTGACSTTNSCAQKMDAFYRLVPANYGNYLCTQFYCENGECTRSFSNYCSCDTNCGAICDSTTTFPQWSETTCRYSCNENCNYNWQRTMCNVNDPITQAGRYCYRNTDKYCYYNVGCTTSGRTHRKGDYCEEETLFEVSLSECIVDDELVNFIPNHDTNTASNSYTLNGCLYEENTNRCDSQGICSLKLDLFKCAEGFEPSCTASGAKCGNYDTQYVEIQLELLPPANNQKGEMPNGDGNDEFEIITIEPFRILLKDYIKQPNNLELSQLFNCDQIQGLTYPVN